MAVYAVVLMYEPSHDFASNKNHIQMIINCLLIWQNTNIHVETILPMTVINIDYLVIMAPVNWVWYNKQ